MPTPETPSERVAIVVWYLAHDMGLSTKEVSKIVGLKMRGTYTLLDRISRVVPIYQDDALIWRVCKAQDVPCAVVK